MGKERHERENIGDRIKQKGSKRYRVELGWIEVVQTMQSRHE